MLNHFPKKTYRQRWQIETTFSMLKRLLGSALRSRKRYAIDREIVLRVLTINLMIILRLLYCFQQSMTVTYFTMRYWSFYYVPGVAGSVFVAASFSRF